MSAAFLNCFTGSFLVAYSLFHCLRRVILFTRTGSHSVPASKRNGRPRGSAVQDRSAKNSVSFAWIACRDASANVA